MGGVAPTDAANQERPRVSYPTDLLPYGELFAELDFVVRQLDDGSLTVTQDDTLPDEGRVRISAAPQGLNARLSLFPSAAPSQLLSDAMDRLNTGGRVRFAWFDNAVWCESTIPWTNDHQFPGQTLRALFRGVCDSGATHGANLSGLADQSGSQAAPGGAPASDPSPASDPAPVGSALPPSFLPGVGQNDTQGATQRYGHVQDVPGRAEAGSGELNRTPTAERVQQHRDQQLVSGGGSSGGGGAGKLGVLGTIVLVVALAGAKFVLRGGIGDDDEDEGPVAQASPDPNPSSSPPDDPDAPVPFPVRASPTPEGPDPDETPEPTPSRAASPGSSSDPLGIFELANSAREHERLIAVKRWRDRGLGKKPKGHLRLLQALAGRLDSKTRSIVTKSLRQHPPGVYEALDCLEYSNTTLRRVLIEQISHSQLSADEVSVAVEVISEIKDTPDLMVEEALIRIGKPKPGGLQRLIEARGIEWLRLGGGRELLAKFPAKSLGELASSKTKEVRLLAVGHLGERTDEVDEALKLLAKILKDSDTEVRRRSIQGIGRLRNGRGAWYLALALPREKDKRTQELIRNALSRLPVKASTRFLTTMIKSKNPTSRVAAVMSLRSMQRPETIVVLVNAIKDKDRAVRMEVLSALVATLGNSELRPLIARGILSYRTIAKDRSDQEARRLARRLCLKIDGRLP
jgi:hypothetical protein